MRVEKVKSTTTFSSLPCIADELHIAVTKQQPSHKKKKITTKTVMNQIVREQAKDREEVGERGWRVEGDRRFSYRYKLEFSKW